MRDGRDAEHAGPDGVLCGAEPPDKELPTVYTDSVYLRESCEKRLMHWKENGWKTAHNEPIKNRDLWQQVSEKLDMHVILFGAEEDNEYRERMKAELADRRAGNV